MSIRPRLVDAYLPLSRTKPMEVLCLGMCRTGTESLNAALKQLGYTPHKMGAIMKNYKVNIPLWLEALRAKYEGEGKVWGRKEFDVMLGNYDCVLDIPPLMLVEDIVAAYPNAKVILTYRDEKSWLRSMQDTAGQALTWWTYPYIWKFDKNSRLRVGFLWQCMEYLFHKDFSDDGPALQVYRDHNELVRKVVAPEKLLEFRADQGWGPLCKFLGKDIPDGPYPRVNDKAHLIKWQKIAYYIAIVMAAFNISVVVLTPILTARYLWRKFGG